MSLVTTLKSDVYHLLYMCHVYIEVTIKFLALENLTLNFFELLDFWDVGVIEISQGQQIYIYIHVSVFYHNQFSKDILSTDSQFTHISAVKAETNTLSQSPCKATPHPTKIMMS